jgi:hypothetical protein
MTASKEIRPYPETKHRKEAHPSPLLRQQGPNAHTTATDDEVKKLLRLMPARKLITETLHSNSRLEIEHRHICIAVCTTRCGLVQRRLVPTTI